MDLIRPRSILKMRVNKGKLAWLDLRFKSKTRPNQFFDAWCLKVMGFLRVTKSFVLGRSEESCNLLEVTILRWSSESHTFMVLRWSTESHMFVAAWGEFTLLWRISLGWQSCLCFRRPVECIILVGYNQTKVKYLMLPWLSKKRLASWPTQPGCDLFDEGDGNRSA